MIKNQRQYQITKAQLDAFDQALVRPEVAAPNTADAELRKLEQDAIRSQMETLRSELEEYDELVSGRTSVIEVNSFEDLPRALIQARIASGMSQRELALKLGLKEQQIQRYEATDYESASLSRIGEVVRALGLNVRKDILLPAASVSLKTVWDRARAIGIPREFITNRLLPRAVAARLHQGGDEDRALAITIAGILGRIFGFPVAALFGTSQFAVAALPAQLARFKLPSRANSKAVTAYSVYAHYLSMLVLESTRQKVKHKPPDDWKETRDAILDHYGELTFSSALSYVWDLGIAVLPLNDHGTFHGACWRVGGRNVVVLKQRTRSLARWLIDLLHELFHALDEPGEKEFAVIEESEMSEDRRNSQVERDATEFAGDVVLDGRADELAELCAHLAGGSIPRLKGVVRRVAAQEEVDLGVLANYLAFRLAAQGEDWWGTAQNLQATADDPWRVARDVLMERIDFGRLNSIDRDLLSRALMEPEE